MYFLKYHFPIKKEEHNCKQPANKFGVSHLAFNVTNINDFCNHVVKFGGSIVNKPAITENKKFQVGAYPPTTGPYLSGDIVWNNNPQPTGYVGWICTRPGSPGEWKAFGLIES